MRVIRRTLGLIWAWIHSWFGFANLSRQLSSVEQRIQEARRESKRSERVLGQHLAELLEIQQQMEIKIENTRGSLNRSVEANRKLEAALDAAQESLKTANEVVIPGLVAAHQVLVSRWEHETQVLTMRSVVRREE